MARHAIRVLAVAPGSVEAASAIQAIHERNGDWPALVGALKKKSDILLDLNERKQLFEKLLGKKLVTVQSASLNTYIDGYSSYDPDTNTADAVTSLNVVFDLGGRTSLPLPATK